MSAKVSRYVSSAFRWLLVLVISFVALFPIYVLALTSLKSRRDLFSGILSFRGTFTLENFSSVWDTYNFLFYMENSLVIALMASLVTLIAGTFAAYGFSKYRFRAKAPLLMCIIGLRMIPPVSLIIPIFIIASRTGLNDTRTILVLVNTALNLPFIIWLLKGFFDEISNELIEAAYIDGCSDFGTFSKIALPLVKPGLFATSVFTFILTWNDFMFPLVLSSVRATTLPIMATNFMTEHGVEWGNLGAAGVMILLPVVIISLLTQRWLVSGLTQGAVKG